jgi:hypothetical protein
MRRLKIETGESDGSGGFTEFLNKHKQRPIFVGKAPEEVAETRINSTFVLLMSTLCLGLPTELKWDIMQREITSELGNANIRCVVDGGLVDRDGECHIIIEVKAQRRTERTWKPLLMQQGLEFLAFIAHTCRSSNTRGCGKQRKHKDRLRPSR